MVKFLRVKVIFFDAAGTLFHVKGSVGEIYSRLAARYGVDSDPEETERLFVHAFRTKSSEGIGPDDTIEPEVAEKRWWEEIVRRVFAGRMSGPAVHGYFEEVFEYFRSAAAWELYPESRDSLEDLRLRGLRLAVVSNFDSRLFDVLQNLGIGSLLEGAYISWRVGAAKPDPRIFRAAVESMGVAPDCALHVGDSLREDFEGAANAGLHAVLLDRSGLHKGAGDVATIRNLNELRKYVC